MLPSYVDAQRCSDAQRYSCCSFSVLQHTLAAAAVSRLFGTSIDRNLQVLNPREALVLQDGEEPWAVVCWSFIGHHWVSGSAPGRAQLRGVHKLHSPWSCAGSSCVDLVILTWTVHPNTPAHGSGGAGWGKQSDRGWDKRVAEFRGWGFGGTLQIYLGSEQESLKHSQIERQTLCHKNASSVACGCFNAHTVLVLHADPFDSKLFNRQRTYGKNHTTSDDRYYLIWAGKPIRKGQGNFHSRGVIGQSLRLGFSPRRFCV